MHQGYLSHNLPLGVDLVQHRIDGALFLLCQLLYIPASINLLQLHDAVDNSDQKLVSLRVHDSVTEGSASIEHWRLAS